jgi:hypothetical protein
MLGKGELHGRVVKYKWYLHKLYTDSSHKDLVGTAISGVKGS